MTMTRTRPRHGALSIAMIVTSMTLAVGISIAMDVVLLSNASAVATQIALSAILFNISVILFSGVGSIIEWSRPGHGIGRLLMLSGPLYAFLGASWLAFGMIEP